MNESVEELRGTGTKSKWMLAGSDSVCQVLEMEKNKMSSYSTQNYNVTLFCYFDYKRDTFHIGLSKSLCSH